MWYVQAKYLCTLCECLDFLFLANPNQEHYRGEKKPSRGYLTLIHYISFSVYVKKIQEYWNIAEDVKMMVFHLKKI